MSYDCEYNPADYNNLEPPPWLTNYNLVNEPVRPLHQLTRDDPEVWMGIDGFMGAYEVSSHGRVRSLSRRIVVSVCGEPVTRTIHGRILEGCTSNGYRTVSLGKGHPAQVSRLVAATFIGPRPHKLFVLHSDGNSRNDCVSNLRYGTQFENVKDAIKHGTFARGERMPHAKLTDRLAAIAKGLRGVVTEEFLAQQFGCSRGVIHRVRTGEIWAHVTALEPGPALAALSELVQLKEAA